MSISQKMFLAITVGLILVIVASKTEARMLPTRSNEDQLDKLRELLRDILENDDSHPKVSNSLVEKRGGGYDTDDYKSFKDYPHSALNDRDLRYLAYYKKALPLKLYGLMKNGDD